jgi:hypothetical protein
MSYVKIEGNASGTGTFTIAAPNSNTDRTLTLPDEAGTVLTSGGAIDVDGSAPADSIAIDSSGNLLVGKTSSGTQNTADGFELRQSGYLFVTKSSDTVAYFNRRTTDGSIVEFRKDGTTVGSIGTEAGTIKIVGGDGTSNGGSGLIFFNTTIYPTNGSGGDVDNVVDLGKINARWDDVYATNGTIQTSDRNEKQDIEELSEAETRAAIAAKGLLKKFRWKDAVAEKGDEARIHFGIIAQELQAAFEAEGLDAGRYAMFIHSTWWETYTDVPAVEAVDAVYETQTDEEGNEVQVLVSEAVEAKEAYTRTDTYHSAEEAPEGAVEKSRMGVRYSELLAFIIAAL